MGDDDRLRELIAAYRSGAIGEPEARELATALRDPRAAADLRAELDWAGLTAAAFASEDAAFVARTLARLDGPRAAPRPRRTRPWTLVALAATVLLALGWWWFTESRRIERAEPADPLEAMVVAGRAFREDGSGMETTARVRPGEQLRTDGGRYVKIRWPDGTEARLEKHGQLSLLAGPGKHVRLTSGTLTVDAAKQPDGAPLLLETPQALATVVGTRFTLAADDGDTRLEVQHGSVRLADHAGHEITIADGWRGEVRGVLPPLLVPTLAAATVTVAVGDDLQRAIDANQPGTVFRIATGIHRLAQARPKERDVFIGEPGAVLSGAVELTGFTRDDHGWAIGGQRQHGEVHGKAQPGNDGSPYPEQLFLDDQPLRHVRALDQLGPTTWFFDYEAGVIHLGADPTGHRVETSVAPFAFGGDASNVTIVGLTVEKYANPAQMAAIGFQNPAERWSVVDCEVRLTHGAGITASDGWRVQRCLVHDNGQLGIGAVGADTIIGDNGLFENNTLGFDPTWEAGGAVFSGTRSLVVRGNRVSRNAGVGILLENGDEGAAVEANVVQDNARVGIGAYEGAHERIARNHVSGNGRGYDRWAWGAQILVRDCDHPEIDANQIEIAADHGCGIVVMQQDCGGRLATGAWVHDNEVTHLGAAGFSGAVADWNPEALWRGGNRFDRNHYHAADLGAKYWEWSGSERTWDEFRAHGLEEHGTVDAQIPRERVP